MPQKRDINGITLIEFLITLAILVIFAVISTPLFRTFLRNYRITGPAENIYAALQYARTEAIKQNRTIYVSFVTGDNWCYGLNATNACNCTIAGNCTLGHFQADVPQRSVLTMAGFAGNTIQFESTRAAANASGTIRLTEYGGTTYVEIAVGKLGGLKICSNNITRFGTC